MKIKINETYDTPIGIKQEEIVLENILTVSDISDNLHLLTRDGKAIEECEKE